MSNALQLLLHLLFLFHVLSFEPHLSMGTNAIVPSQFLSGNKTISSQNGRFELGFFTPGNSNNYYIGIWYKKIPVQTVVWVANRDKPLLHPFSSKFQLSENGALLLFNESGTRVWSSRLPSNSVNSSVAVLEDSGNLVIKDGRNSSVILWQSFDHPTDTWLPGAKLGLNKVNKEGQVYFSWRNSDDPKPGSFSLELDPNGTKEYFIMQNGNRHWTCGIWPGISVFGPDTLTRNHLNITYVSNEEENYFTYSVTNTSIVARFLLDSSGQLQHLMWDNYSQWWQLIWSRPKQSCEIYAFCGEYGSCNQYSLPTCSCLRGFQPRNQGQWNSGNHTHGCVRKSTLQCSKGGEDGFLLIQNIRLSANSRRLSVTTSKECEAACLRDCSCTGYTFDGECLIWKGDLLNIQYLSFGDKLGRDLQLRLAMTELAALRGKKKERTYWIIIGAIAGGLLSLISVSGLIVWRRMRAKFSCVIKPTEDILVTFKYSELKSATKNFAEKLGEGGFGCVFKGTLPNSVTVAVKRLRSCEQGEKQFRAEVSIIGTIHHINLVRLCGFCAEGMNKFLVYDYMPNGSLDSHLFRNDSKVLGWKARYNIALGIAKGLAYLHEECRDCIIHCDIKPENILLDACYNPMISDFGLAKLLGRDFSRVLTTIKGTRGYLAPEWITGVAVTPKADVFSYGMLLFELISGRRNWNTTEDGMDDYFPARAANIINNGVDVLSLLDYRLEGNADRDEVIKACKVACWCIQDDEKTRPSMGHVVQVLEGLKEVSMPQVPRFIHALFPEEEDDSS
ncbi:hypothetical protein SLA2020_396020 [Shorea laevis]